MSKWIIIGSAVLVSSLIYFGFGSDVGRIKECRVIASQSVVANYSEIETGIDIEGDFYTEVNHWSEPASDVWEVVTVNGEVVYSDVDKPILSTHGYFFCNFPPRDNEMSKESGFDNFSEQRSVRLTVTVDMGSELDQFNDPPSTAKDCNNLRESGGVVDIKTWWGITYGIDR